MCLLKACSSGSPHKHSLGSETQEHSWGIRHPDISIHGVKYKNFYLKGQANCTPIFKLLQKRVPPSVTELSARWWKYYRSCALLKRSISFPNHVLYEYIFVACIRDMRHLGCCFSLIERLVTEGPRLVLTYVMMTALLY